MSYSKFLERHPLDCREYRRRNGIPDNTKNGHPLWVFAAAIALAALALWSL